MTEFAWAMDALLSPVYQDNLRTAVSQTSTTVAIMFTPTLSVLLALGATLFSSPLVSAYALNSTHASRDTCDMYTLSGVAGGFTTRTYIDFTTATAGGSASSFLSYAVFSHVAIRSLNLHLHLFGSRNNGLYTSDYAVASTPIGHTFTPDNVALSTVNGFTALDLKTSAYTSGNVVGAEVGTDDTFKYASVRAVLKSSSTAGIVEGNFFYRE